MSKLAFFDSIVLTERRFDVWLDRFFDQAADVLFRILKIMAVTGFVLMAVYYLGYGLARITTALYDNGFAGVLSLFGVN